MSAVCEGKPRHDAEPAQKIGVDRSVISRWRRQQGFQQWEERLRKAHRVRTFSSAEELRTEIISALSAYRQDERMLNFDSTHLKAGGCWRHRGRPRPPAWAVVSIWTRS
jgi:hypothetical protein